MKEVLVTGGAGFVGSHLIESLVNENIKVTVLDDFSNGSEKNLQQVKDKIQIEKFDISNTDWNSINKYNPDTIFHLATHPRSFSLQDPKRNMEVNVHGTLNVLEFAKKKDAKVIYTSNSGICGDPQFLPVTEEHPIDCKTPYDANKLVGELYAKIYYKIHGVYSVIFRLATVYGERQRVNEKLGWRPLIATLVEKVEKGETPIIQWDGEQTRDLIYVKDVVDCLILGAKSKDHGGEMFLLSTNTETSVNKAHETVCKTIGKNVTPKYGEMLPGDLRRMVLSYDKAKKAFGFSPKVPVEEGVRRYVEWYRKNK
ncbi:UDP-glucose 4-epimerase [Candidatus Nitrosotalea sp. FS]|uniref:NAD-dependent epimerase/dehydratase family protein n=1 Tax=Candidatus Nitrosotalea sp. FS TaxID=2341021 RepID=UPI00140820B9|nr:NAD-dependent epimerase/dehydratase family protein [Candidatus Nitrosotalea sp. FS]NHH96656.1 UDP-glucose 4-epimerase [Candidatus Nitrosotalea sp. FS]